MSKYLFKINRHKIRTDNMGLVLVSSFRTMNWYFSNSKQMNYCSQVFVGIPGDTFLPRIIIPAGNYMLKVNNRNTRCEICSKLTTKIPERRTFFTPCSSISIVNFEQVNAGWDNYYQLLSLRVPLT